MTKNEAWATMCAGINCPDVAPTETIEVIQLDAFKAGAEWAAQIIANRQRQYAVAGLEDRWNTCINNRNDIMIAVSNLKELPK